MFQAQLQEQPLASYVWDLNDPGAPESTLLPSSQITALNFNLKARAAAVFNAAADLPPMPGPNSVMHTYCTSVRPDTIISIGEADMGFGHDAGLQHSGRGHVQRSVWRLRPAQGRWHD